MPELPEVETVKIGLSTLVPGKAIKSVDHDWPGSKPGEHIHYSADLDSGSIVNFSRQSIPDTPPKKNLQYISEQDHQKQQNAHQAYSKSFPNAEVDVRQFLIGAKILEVKRRAKVLIIELSTKYSLLIHLKMTGQLVFRSNDNSKRFGAGHPNSSLVGELPDKSTRVILDFGDGKLFFNDQRKFGWMRLVPTAEIPNIDFFKKIGSEPLSDSFKAKDFIQAVQRRRKSKIKPVLLDQTIIAGVGNIYADESLFAAKIHPETLVQDIPQAKLTKLYKALVAVLKLSIEKGGSSDRNYVDAKGQRGSYLSFAQVFRKDGLACPRCGTIIEKIRVAGRGTHICPHCQPRSRSSFTFAKQKHTLTKGKSNEGSLLGQIKPREN